MTRTGFWHEPDDDAATYQVPADVVDVGFKVRCARLPVDHAWTLGEAVHAILPWLRDEDFAGVHLIHGAETGNGWYRPGEDDYLVLSRRTRLNLRLPAARVADAAELVGTRLEIDDCHIDVGECAEKLLTPTRTVFSRHVAADSNDGESEFLESVAGELVAIGIEPTKMLCGKKHSFRWPTGRLHARSVLVADLEPAESVRLQQHGIGSHQAFGLGLFLPHKGIEAVYQPAEE